MSIITLPKLDESIYPAEFNDLKKRIELIEDHLYLYPDESPICTKCGHLPEINYDHYKSHFEDAGYTFALSKNRKNCFKINSHLFTDNEDNNWIIFRPTILLECEKCKHRIRYASDIMKKKNTNKIYWRTIMSENKVNCLWDFYIMVKQGGVIEEILDTDNFTIIDDEAVLRQRRIIPIDSYGKYYYYVEEDGKKMHGSKDPIMELANICRNKSIKERTKRVHRKNKKKYTPF